jgi:acrylyl-CoA reductase (NADPH)
VTFRALVLEQDDDGVRSSLQELDDDRLPDGAVTVGVEYSSLNYKDGMILRGQGRLVRDYPHVPGIDLAGVVESSDAPDFAPGDRVVLTGWRVGEAHWGGYATRARVEPQWLTKLPDSLTTQAAMRVGTAGFTAMLAIDALERHGVAPGDRPVLVTGAGGGVGSFATHLLARLGYPVTAATGRADTADQLRALGAKEIIDRAEIADAPDRPLLSQRWSACVDAVGGATLAHVLAELDAGGAVAACGNTAGNGLPTSVIPFILRNVALLGIDSVSFTGARRGEIWARIAETVDWDALDGVTTEVGLDGVDAKADEILAGQVRGRVVVATGRDA